MTGIHRALLWAWQLQRLWGEPPDWPSSPCTHVSKYLPTPLSELWPHRNLSCGALSTIPLLPYTKDSKGTNHPALPTRECGKDDGKGWSGWSKDFDELWEVPEHTLDQLLHETNQNQNSKSLKNWTPVRNAAQVSDWPQVSTQADRLDWIVLQRL